MKKNSIISIILNDKNVNLYTKLLIFLYYKRRDNKLDISDKNICKYLKLDIKKDKKALYKALKELEKNNIIKLELKKQRRFFEWLIEEDNTPPNNIHELLDNLVQYDWLNTLQ